MIFPFATALAASPKLNQETQFSLLPQLSDQLPGFPATSTWTPEAALITIGFGIIAVLIAIVSFFAKKQLNDILSTIHTFSDRQSECRESLSIRFADRAETAAHIRVLTARADKQHEVLTRHDVLLNGNGINKEGFFGKA
jgi:hypothetical protein